MFEEKPVKKRGKNDIVAPKPTEMKTMLEHYLATVPFGQVAHLQKLKNSLADIVGLYLTDKVFLEDLKAGTLIVKVPSSVWKHELFAQKKAIIGKCNLILESPIIKDIRFV